MDFLKSCYIRFNFQKGLKMELSTARHRAENFSSRLLELNRTTWSKSHFGMSDHKCISDLNIPKKPSALVASLIFLVFIELCQSKHQVGFSKKRVCDINGFKDEFWSIVQRFLQDIFSAINPRLQFSKGPPPLLNSHQKFCTTLLKQ